MEHLGVYSDLVDAARRHLAAGPPGVQATSEPGTAAEPGPALRQAIRDVLGFTALPAVPTDVRTERTWSGDGVDGEEVSWSVGYGPRTYAWVLKPSGVEGPLPAVVALHSHDGVKRYGKEKIADGPDEPADAVVRLREQSYGGRAFANALARMGFLVVAHDVFLWSSRRFPLETMPDRIRRLGALSAAATGDGPDEAYEAAARLHEDLVAKYCALLGTTLAGVVAYEDRAAVAYLRSRPDVAGDRVGCVGLSGGGCRVALLQATSDEVGAAVIVGMMSTHAALLDRLVDGHTWMFFPSGLARVCDWPDLAASRAPAPLLVQYDRDDQLFTLEGMQAAHELLVRRYQEAGAPDAYRGEFYDGPHKFDVAMQESAFAWLQTHLTPQH
ncbi:MAG TPA: acyl-CoA thioester hydrolase/BAAT C-terminal domain-containing protein [Actinopolymorphaceae bacterium]